MSNTKNNSLVFPSGKTVAQIKKDAKQLKKSEGISTTNALDILAKRNGMKCSYKDAVEALKETNQRKIKPEDNEANQKNPNKGTKGTNRQYDQVHGNRSIQLSRVTFLVPKHLLSDPFIQKHRLQKLNTETAYKLKLISKSDYLDVDLTTKYDFVRFNKPIKGGRKNTSGALQKIRQTMCGDLKNKQSHIFWIGNQRHKDTNHPKYESLWGCGGLYSDGSEYNPFMYD
ncbi:hypothetical protein ACMXYO_01080 [Neptuniibacter sp. QD37_6]|uniref:hypothetical protein n=1 Tax=Neptuniibacter sp. QD37_6 TaxID=3398210 RepID=UPI0039F4CAD4